MKYYSAIKRISCSRQQSHVKIKKKKKEKKEQKIFTTGNLVLVKEIIREVAVYRGGCQELTERSTKQLSGVTNVSYLLMLLL